MCKKCRWSEWLEGLDAMLKTGKVEGYREWIQSARHWIASEHHVTQDIAFMAARIEKGARLDRPHGIETLTRTALQVIKELPSVPEAPPTPALDVLSPEKHKKRWLDGFLDLFGRRK